MIVDAKKHRGGAQAAPVGPDERPHTVGPFAMVAHILPMEIAAGTLPPDMDVRAHPHAGLAAVSYVIDGYITHRDNLGSRREVCPGALSYMIAGRGVVHSERFERLRVLGGRFEMFQILIALPDGSEDMEPSFTYVAAEEVPEVASAGAIARRLDARMPFPAPLLLEDVRLEAGARHPLRGDCRERAVYVLSGEVVVDAERAAAHQVALPAPGDATIAAIRAARVLAFGGEPVGPRFQWWNYLHSSLERIEEARAAWRAGRVTLPPGDTESFTPAPPDEGRPLVRLNQDE